MKNMLTKAWVVLLAVGFLTACTDQFEEINTNPNQPEEVPSTNLLVSGITRSVDRVLGASFNMTYAGLWAQHYAKIQYIDEDYYEFRESAFDAHWEGLYAGPLADLQVVIDDENAGTNVKAVSKIMKSYIFSVVTDMWGDVPYSQALNVDEFVQPVYDRQEDIYADLISTLETAANELDAGADALGSGDVIYGGNTDQWKKFANSLRARLLNRIAGVDAAAAGKLADFFDGSVALFESNDDNMCLEYPGTPNRNPLFENKVEAGRNDHAVSATLVDLLMSLDDPRLPVYAELNINGEYAGQPNGTDQPANLSDVSPIGSSFRDDPNAPVCAMAYAELKFIEAEVTGSKDAYLAGIAASMDMYGVSADDDYYAAAGDFFDDNMMQAIITHKWVALFGNGPEAYSEFRRTGFPATIEEVPGSRYPGRGIPHRFAYPSIELITNGANAIDAIQRQGLDSDEPVYGETMFWVQ